MLFGAATQPPEMFSDYLPIFRLRRAKNTHMGFKPLFLRFLMIARRRRENFCYISTGKCFLTNMKVFLCFWKLRFLDIQDIQSQQTG